MLYTVILQYKQQVWLSIVVVHDDLENHLEVIP